MAVQAQYPSNVLFLNRFNISLLPHVLNQSINQSISNSQSCVRVCLILAAETGKKGMSILHCNHNQEELYSWISLTCYTTTATTTMEVCLICNTSLSLSMVIITTYVWFNISCHAISWQVTITTTISILEREEERYIKMNE